MVYPPVITPDPVGTGMVPEPPARGRTIPAAPGALKGKSIFDPAAP
jgi:hypothetical protein